MPQQTAADYEIDAPTGELFAILDGLREYYRAYLRSTTGTCFENREVFPSETRELYELLCRFEHDPTAEFTDDDYERLIYLLGRVDIELQATIIKDAFKELADEVSDFQTDARTIQAALDDEL